MPLSVEIHSSAKPEAMMRLPVGLTSPLWGYFAGAAIGGTAWWLMTRWARPQNLEAMFGEAAPAEAPAEALPEPAVEVISEAGAEAPAMVEEPVAEPVVEVVAVPALEAEPEPVLEVEPPIVVGVEAIAEAEPIAEEPAAPKPRVRKAAPMLDLEAD